VLLPEPEVVPLVDTLTTPEPVVDVDDVLTPLTQVTEPLAEPVPETYAETLLLQEVDCAELVETVRAAKRVDRMIRVRMINSSKLLQDT
jgi:hypothetical protein